MVKHLNIVDPLRGFNNLGRSVSYNNFLRIRRALKKGAKTLTDILTCTDETQSDKILRVFFKNVSERYLGDISSMLHSTPKQEPPQYRQKDPTTNLKETVFDSKLEDCRNCLETAHSLLNTTFPQNYHSISNHETGLDNQLKPTPPIPSTPPRRSSSASNFISSPLSPLNSSAIYNRNLTLMTVNANAQTSNNLLSVSTLPQTPPRQTSHLLSTSSLIVPSEVDVNATKAESSTADLTVNWTANYKPKTPKKSPKAADTPTEQANENLDPGVNGERSKTKRRSNSRKLKSQETTPKKESTPKKPVK